MQARRVRWMAAAAVAALVVSGCGGDDADDAADATDATAEDATTEGSASDGPADGAEAADEGDDADGAGGPEGAGADSCPSQTVLHAVTETTTGDVERVPAGTAFPAAHFTLDLDGSGFGPILDGVLSTDAGEDVASMTHGPTDPPAEGTLRVEVLLQGPPAGATEMPLGVYDVTFEGGTVAPTDGAGLAQLDVREGSTSYQASHFTELEVTHIGDGVICGELRPVDRGADTSQVPTWIEGSFVADYSEQP